MRDFRLMRPVAIAAFAVCASAGLASAASSAGCEGGGFTIVMPNGSTVTKATIPAGSLGATILVRGKYVEFTIVTATLGVKDYTLTGAFNSLDITGGRRTVVYASKTPQLPSALSGDLKIEAKDTDLVVERKSRSVKMKIQAKDCAQGGIFQMEPELENGGAVDIVHTLATGVFYFDNPNFRNPPALPLCPAAGPFTPSCFPVAPTPRVNFGNDFSAKFVGRDSAQVATRINQFGGVSTWRVQSGGRMGGVLGEDSVEVGPPPTNCTENCQAENQVRGRFPILGFPFPVPQASRLTPRTP